MARMIDADLLWQEVRDDADITGRAYQAVKEHILGAKTVDAVEVVHGCNVYDETEEAFKNGAEYMRGLIIDKLRDRRGKAMGQERVILGELIEKIMKMEVRT